MATLSSAKSSVKFSLYPWLICSLGALFYCYEYALRIAPSVMTNDLMGAYGLSATALGSLIAFYYHAYTPMQLPVGLMMDYYGPRRLLTVATLLCALGTYMFATAGHFALAATGRFLVGFGSAFAFVGVLKLATIWLPPERFAMISGMATALGMFGAALGDNFLAALVKIEGWRNTLLYSAILGIGLAAVIYLLVRDHVSPDDQQRKIDSREFKQLFIALWKLSKHPQIWLNGLVGCLLFLPTSMFAEVWGIPYLQASYHFSNATASGAISMIFLGWVVGGPLAGYISDRIGLRRAPMIVGALFAALLISLVLYVPGLSITEIYLIFFIFGIFCSAQIIVFAIGREISPNNLAGTAIALTNMIVMLGGDIFQPLIGKLLDYTWNGTIIDGVHQYTANDYRQALIVLPVGILLGAALTLLIRETHCCIDSRT